MHDATPAERPDAFNAPTPSERLLPTRVSRLSIVALGFNIPFFLPPFTITAALLGVVAYLRVRRRGDLGGSALAIAAILAGTLLTAVMTPYWWGFIRLTTQGPVDAIRAAERGDGDAFRDIVTGDSALLSDSAITAFAAEMRARYGTLREGAVMRVNEQIPQKEHVWTVPFEMKFETGPRRALIDFTTVDPVTGRSTLALSAIVIVDEERGNLRFPTQSRTLNGS